MDIIFVSGFTKTSTMWAVAAFSDNNRGEELVIASGRFEGLTSIQSRDGPCGRISTWEDGSAVQTRPVHFSQLLLVAGPDTLPDEDEDEDDRWADLPSSMSASSDSNQGSDYIENAGVQCWSM